MAKLVLPGTEHHCPGSNNKMFEQLYLFHVKFLPLLLQLFQCALLLLGNFYGCALTHNLLLELFAVEFCGDFAEAVDPGCDGTFVGQES